jgi:hypothetical protein
MLPQKLSNNVRSIKVVFQKVELADKSTLRKRDRDVPVISFEFGQGGLYISLNYKHDLIYVQINITLSKILQ